MTSSSTSRVDRFYAFLRARLSAPNAERNVLLLSLALMLPSLNTGLGADDYLHQIILQGSHVLDGFDRPRLDIFRFCDPHLSPGFLRVGVFTWWDDPNTRLAFFRPVSALTHWLDYALWPNSPWLMHLQCLLWGALVLFGVRALYRELVTDRFVATLALALYALDDARGWFVQWVASRNGVVATSLSLWAFVAFCRGRKGNRAAAIYALPLLALGLLSGEGAIAIYGFIFAYVLFLEEGPIASRVLRLWPYAVLLVAWRVVYRMLGYGASGSGLYADPLGDPLSYALGVIERGPVLLFAQIGGPWSEVWNSLFVFPRLRIVYYVGALVAIACVGALIRPYVKRDPVMRFALASALLATLPASAAFPADRLLTWVPVGACLVLAAWLAPILKREAGMFPQGVLGRVAPLVAFLVVVKHLVVGPLLIPSRARGTVAMRDVFDRCELGTPMDHSIEDKVLVFVNPPAVPFASYVPITRAALGIPRARAQRILATSVTPLRIERLDANTLRLSPRGGFLQDTGSRLMWTPKRPFTPGERIVIEETTYVVREVTADHRPLVVDVRFDHALEDPRYLYRQWVETRYQPWIPPAIGSAVTLPGAEFIRAVFGQALPVEARMDP